MLMLREANERYSQNDLHAAQELYEQIRTREPRLLEAQFRLGVIAHRMGNSELAGEHFKEVLERDPRHAAATYNLGALHAQRAHALLSDYLLLAHPKAADREQVQQLIRALEDFARKN